MSEAIGQPGQAALPRPLGLGEILSTTFQLYRRSHPALDTPRWVNGRSADAPATVGRSRNRAAMATLSAVSERETRASPSTSTTAIPTDNPGQAADIELSKPCERSCARR